MKVTFKVQHHILSGLKYLQVIKRMGVSQKTQEMIGSYGPNTTDKPIYEKKCKCCPQLVRTSDSDSDTKQSNLKLLPRA